MKSLVFNIKVYTTVTDTRKSLLLSNNFYA